MKKTFRRRRKVDAEEGDAVSSVGGGGGGGGEEEEEEDHGKSLPRRRQRGLLGAFKPSLSFWPFRSVLSLLCSAVVLVFLDTALDLMRGPSSSSSISSASSALSSSLEEFAGLRPRHVSFQPTVFLDDEEDEYNNMYHFPIRYPRSSFDKALPRWRQYGDEKEWPELGIPSLLFTDRADFIRSIQEDDAYRSDKERSRRLRKMDGDIDEYYYHFDELEYPRECVRPQWAFQSYPTCNALHEYRLDRAITRHTRDLVDYTSKYIASGHYRDTWITTEPDADFVLKRLRLRKEFDFDHRRMFKTFAEALVMERLAHSPVIADIYAHCGTSVAVQRANPYEPEIVPHLDSQYKRGRMSQAALDEIEATSSYGVVSLNKWSVPEKLKMIIDMVEALAEMHYSAGGVIMHDDIKPEQWLITDDGTFVLGDVNNAVVVQWNPVKKEYCKKYTKYHGTLRPPEEFKGDNNDETVDLWNIGDMIFIILTGLYPYYTLWDDREIAKVTMTGVPPYLNPKYRTRSFIEGRLVELMDMCFKFVPSERATAAQLLEHLYATQRLYEAEHQEKR